MVKISSRFKHLLSPEKNKNKTKKTRKEKSYLIFL